jgi:hypothetical protein
VAPVPRLLSRTSSVKLPLVIDSLIVPVGSGASVAMMPLTMFLPNELSMPSTPSMRMSAFLAPPTALQCAPNFASDEYPSRSKPYFFQASGFAVPSRSDSPRNSLRTAWTFGVVPSGAVIAPALGGRPLPSGVL